MRKFLTAAVLAIGTFGGIGLEPELASAMPMVDRAPAIVAQEGSLQPEQVRIVCGPYRCFRRPNYYYGFRHPSYYGYRRPFYGPRFRPYGFYRGYGWHRHGWRHRYW